jgi:predicted SnoaL-like aldol condensation-catalyzing enzyme
MLERAQVKHHARQESDTVLHYGGIDVVVAPAGNMKTGGPSKTAAALARVAGGMTPEQGDYVWAHVNFINLFNDDPKDPGIASVDIYRMNSDGKALEHWANALAQSGGQLWPVVTEGPPACGKRTSKERKDLGEFYFWRNAGAKLKGCWLRFASSWCAMQPCLIPY